MSNHFFDLNKKKNTIPTNKKIKNENQIPDTNHLFELKKNAPNKTLINTTTIDVANSLKQNEENDNHESPDVNHLFELRKDTTNKKIATTIVDTSKPKRICIPVE